MESGDNPSCGMGLIAFFLTLPLYIVLLASSPEYGVKKRVPFLFCGSEMHRHIAVFLAEEKNVRLKHECYVAVKFKHCIQPALQEAAERTEFLLAFNNDFHVIYCKAVMRPEQFDKVGEIQIVLIFTRLVIALVYFTDDFLCDHIVIRM